MENNFEKNKYIQDSEDEYSVTSDASAHDEEIEATQAKACKNLLQNGQLSDVSRISHEIETNNEEYIVITDSSDSDVIIGSSFNSDIDTAPASLLFSCKKEKLGGKTIIEASDDDHDTRGSIEFSDSIDISPSPETSVSSKKDFKRISINGSNHENDSINLGNSRSDAEEIKHDQSESLSHGNSVKALMESTLINGSGNENPSLCLSASSIMENSRSDIEEVEDNQSKSFGCEILEMEKSKMSDAEISHFSTGSNSSDHICGSQNSSDRGNLSIEPESDKSILERQIAHKKSAHQNLLRALHGCNPKKLKDGGKLLQENFQRCDLELKALKAKLADLMGTEGGSPEVWKPRVQQDPLFSTKDQMTSNLGKKGLETHRIQAALTVDSLVTLHDSLKTCPSEDTFERDPRGLNVELMLHQKHALAWLLWREQQAPPGGILADDMGLGKTLTMISLVLRAAEYKDSDNDHDSWMDARAPKTYPGKTLVVCPASLLDQWALQIKQHCKRNVLQVLIHHGKPRERQAKRLARYEIVITTYGIVSEENKFIEGKDKKGPLLRVVWERIILDEAHIIRNPKTQKSLAVCDLEGKFRWCLTGTPVHNKELDMYGLLKFLRCAPFDDIVIWKRWVDNKSANGVQRLNTVVKSILLRRTKEDLKQQGELKSLPSKQIVQVYIELDHEELKVYHKLLNFSKTLLAQYLHQKEEKTGLNPERIRHVQENLKNMGDIKTTEILVLLLRLRQVCCLPGLIQSMLEKETCAEDGIEAEDPVMEDLFTQVKRLSIGNPKHHEMEEDKTKNTLVTSNPVFNLERPSKKITTVLNIIKEVMETEEDKVVVVSQWVGLLKKLESHLRSLGVGIVTLDGSVRVKDRGPIISEFNRTNGGPRIMLLSLNAGGVGLNLIGGNRLIIFEPHWNPQLESQACDRVYRVGQNKEVYIYKVICRDTVEERIELLQRKKMELADNVLKGEVKREISKLSLMDLMVLFDVRAP